MGARSAPHDTNLSVFDQLYEVFPEFIAGLGDVYRLGGAVAHVLESWPGFRSEGGLRGLGVLYSSTRTVATHRTRSDRVVSRSVVQIYRDRVVQLSHSSQDV